MPIIKYPIDKYSVTGTAMLLSGEYGGFDIELCLNRATEDQVKELDEFLISKGWLKCKEK